MRGRRCARHGADSDPSAGRRPLGLRHRHRRREGDTRDELAQPLGDDFSQALAELEERARDALIEQGVAAELIELNRRARLRTAGSDTTLEIPRRARRRDALRRSRSCIDRRFGYWDEGAEVIVDALVVEAVGKLHTASSDRHGAGEEDATAPSALRAARPPLQMRGGDRGPRPDLRSDLDHRRRAGLARRRASDGTLVLTRATPLERGKAIGTDVDPVRLEIFNNLFMAIAEEMGVALQSTATSVNIKERLDFSCAIFDAEGALIANAPHIPVHLGSMGESIRTSSRLAEREGTGAESAAVTLTCSTILIAAARICPTSR